jgi:hypothetical protein
LKTLLLRVRDQNPLWGALLCQGLLKNLGSTARSELRRQQAKAPIPSDADMTTYTIFIDDFWANDTAALDRNFIDHDWTLKQPEWLYQGNDDQTVTCSASTQTLQALQKRGAVKVSLTNCPIASSGHLEWLPSFIEFAVSKLKDKARDL